MWAPLSPPELVIFDCDGVLVNSEPPMHQELRDALADHGLDMTLEACLDAFMGLSIEALLQSARNMGAQLPADFRADLYSRVHTRLARGVDLIPGVDQVIARLQEAGIPFCVASNGSEAKMELMLDQHGLWEMFRDHCFSAQSLGIVKPDPGLLRHALDKMGVPRSRAVVIEDSATGVQGAINAEVACLHFTPRSKALPLHRGVYRFSSMRDIGDFLFG